MKPGVLTLEAFGPYARKQIVDFGCLEGTDLVLIEGPTGAGKSTLFDAISFALYGRVPGARGKTLDQLRSTLPSAAESETRVSFSFSLRDEHYRVERIPEQKRRKKRGEGETLDRTKAWLYAVEGSSERLLASQPREVDDKVREITGLTAEEFNQILVLPQGEFRAFLLSSSKEKEEMMRQLFGDTLFSRVTELIGDDTRSKTSSLERLDEHLKRRFTESGFIDLAAIGAVKDETALTVPALRKDLEVAEEKAASAQRALGLADSLAKRFEARARLEAQKATLDGNAARIAESTARLARAERAEEARASLTHFTRAKAALEASAKASKEIDRSLAAATKRAEAAMGLEASVLADREAIEELTAKRARAAQLLEAERDLRERIDGARKLETELHALERAHEAAHEEQKAHGKAAREAERQLEEARKAHTASLAATLAEGLTEGAPCPVCGSTDHPHKASGERARVSEKALRTAETALSRAKGAELDAAKREREVAEARSSCVARRDERMREIEERKKRLIDALEGAESAARSCAELDASIATTKERIAASLREVESALKERASATERKATHEARLLAQKAELDGAEHVVVDIAMRLGLDLDALRAALLDPHARAAMRAEIDAHAQKAAEVTGALKELDGALSDRAMPDLETAKAAARGAREVRDAIAKGLHDAEARVVQLAALAREIESTQKERAAIAAELQLLVPLDAALRGHNARGVSLSRYVLAAKMEEVASAATERLLRMSQGRYLLRLASERSFRGASGLDLLVEDRYAGESLRPVHTLSGGEMFLASLSLAMGLADVVQRHAGGVRLEALFVDEGFGTLDDETLDHAMRTLLDLRAGGRLVGIISHLETLKERIPTRIAIRKAPAGSVVRMPGPQARFTF